MAEEGPKARTHADDLFDLLCHLHSALERHGIWHCLIFGTLLGAVRDGDIIAWDHDLDLLVRPRDIDQLLGLNHELADEGLWFWSGRAMANQLAFNPGGVPWFDPSYLSIMTPSGSRGEMYAPILFDDGVLRLYDLEHEVAFWPHSSFPVFVVEQQLTTVKICGVPFPAPRHCEELLSWHYGPDWRTPYQSTRDGGVAREGLTSHGDNASPFLAEAIAWCEAQGWDRSVYRAQPTWPRQLNGAGPAEGMARTATTSNSVWWHTLEELSLHF